MKHNFIFLLIGGISGGFSVLISAWGAHGLATVFERNPQDRFAFNYATNFHIIHSMLLVVIALFNEYSNENSRSLKCLCIFLLFGILLFCFPIYLRIIFDYTGFSFVTPFGGICFFISWLLISIFAMGKIYALGNISSQYRK